MKNKTTLAFCAVFFLCSFSLKINAQEEKNKRSFFDLEIVNYSDKADADKEHTHLLQITNNSNNTNEFELYTRLVDCDNRYENVVNSKRGFVDNTKETNSSRKKINSSLNLEIYDKPLNKTLSKITLKPKESYEFYLKITRKNNSEAGKWKCSKIVTKSLNDRNSKMIKSVIIKSFIPDSNKKGH